MTTPMKIISSKLHLRLRRWRVSSFALLSVAVSVALVSTVNAAAGDLTYSANTTIALTSPAAYNWTIQSSSTAESLVVNAGSVVVTLGAGDVFTITSASTDFLVSGDNANITVSNTCSSAQLATLVITSSSGTGSYTLTPSGALCGITPSSSGSGGSSSGGGGGGSGTGTYTPPTTPTTPTPSTTETPTTPAPTADEVAQQRAEQIVQIQGEAVQVNTATPEALATAVGATRNESLETQYEGSIVSKIVPSGTAATVTAQISAFVTYGTPTTLKLGAGERGGVVNSFQSAFGRLPQSETDWQDVLKIANGRFPGQTNADKEKTAETSFKTIYKRAPNRANANDDAAVVIMAYGLRNAVRNLNSEAAAIKSYKAIFGKTPTTASNWDAARAIAYSGATR